MESGGDYLSGSQSWEASQEQRADVGLPVRPGRPPLAPRALVPLRPQAVLGSAAPYPAAAMAEQAPRAVQAAQAALPPALCPTLVAGGGRPDGHRLPAPASHARHYPQHPYAFSTAAAAPDAHLQQQHQQHHQQAAMALPQHPRHRPAARGSGPIHIHVSAGAGAGAMTGTSSSNGLVWPLAAGSGGAALQLPYPGAPAPPPPPALHQAQAQHHPALHFPGFAPHRGPEQHPVLWQPPHQFGLPERAQPFPDPHPQQQQHHHHHHQQQQQQPSARRRSRRPNAKRSLGRAFDLAATLQERDQLEADRGRQQQRNEAGSAGSSEDAMEEESEGSPLPKLDLGPGTSRHHAAAASRPQPEATLPLQHLLMSERAQHLTALEVKAILYRVAADLATCHAAGASGHCQVSISTISMAPDGNLTTTHLLHSSGGSSKTAHGSSTGCVSAEAPQSSQGAAGACCALGFGARWAGRAQRGRGDVAAVDGAPGAGAYLPPEVTRCGGSVAAVAGTPSADMWSLGVVLFVLLSGGYVPFGHRGLCQACVPSLPGPSEKVDTVQDWLEAHLYHKVSVIQQISREQAEGGSPLAQMRVVGFDCLSCDLLLSLLKADPAQRLSAVQVLSHPWLSDVVGLVPGPCSLPIRGSAGDARAAAPTATPSPPIPTRAGAGKGARGPAERRCSGAASAGLPEALGSGCFSPSTPTGVADALFRDASAASLTPTESDGSDSFMGSVSDLLLLSGAAASLELEEGPSSPLSEDLQPYAQPLFPRQPQRQQLQLLAPQEARHAAVLGVLPTSTAAERYHLQHSQRQQHPQPDSSYAAAVLGRPRGARRHRHRRQQQAQVRQEQRP